MNGTQKAFKISTLVFIHDEQSRLLLLRRSKAPNLGKWSPIGGKLDMHTGESPFECARRETLEETGLQVEDCDLHLFGYVSEKSYEGSGHWLMFLFHCHKPISALPKNISEGEFGLFHREEVKSLPVPETDHELIWKPYDEHKEGFIGIRADCAIPGDMKMIVETQP